MVTQFKVSTPFAAISARVQVAKSRLQTERRELLEAIGVTLLSFAQQDYRTLSRGGTSSDGRKWKALDPKTVARKAARGRKTSRTNKTGSGKPLPTGNISAIGIDTGLQQASGAPGFNAAGGGNIFEIKPPDEVTVGYGRSYSKFFDMQRKLLPDKLPASWRLLLQSVVGRWLQKIVDSIAGS